MSQKAKQLHSRLLDIEDRLLDFDTYPQTVQAAFEKKLTELESLLTVSSQDSDEVTLNEAELMSGKIFIWSDGACSGNPGPGGWGTIVQSQNRYEEISGFQPKSTNNIMEMTGALEGLKMTTPGAEVVLTTDSQYLVKGMTQWIKGWKKKGWKKADGNPVLNMAIWKALDLLVVEC